ncbi:sodium:calcium antiporter [Candidatus Babeliales bacterium]|nr:sodium:calcium antiporter [Candidatus Babeliales bacterium]
MVVTVFALFGIVASFLVLWWSSDHVVDHALSVARLIGISPFLVGAVLIAVLTSLPELIVGLASVARGIPTLGVGDIFGSNLCDISIALFIPLFFVKKLALGKGGRAGILFMLLLSSISMIVFIGLGATSRWGGAFLIGSYFVALYAMWYRKEIDVEEYHEEFDVGRDSKREVALLLGHMLLAIGSGLTSVCCGEIVAKSLGVSAGVLGTLIFSLGTSIPEIAIGINAARRGSTDFVLGSAVGSVLSQALLIFGIISMVNGAPISLTMFSNIPVFVALMYSFLAYRVYSMASITKFDGVVLSLLYILFYVFELGSW